MTPDAGPSTAKSLGDPLQVRARHVLLARAHCRPILALARRIAHAQGAPVPYPDPLDGGAAARLLLLLLETPGPAVGRTMFVSRDNPTGTAANLFRFLGEAGLARRDTLIWNTVPWVIHAQGARNRAPRRSEIRAAMPYLAPLVACLPRLAVVVLAGRVAAEARPVLERLVPDVPIRLIPHPSPTYVCTAPSVRERIVRGLSEAASILDALPDDGRPSLVFAGQTA